MNTNTRLRMMQDDEPDELSDLEEAQDRGEMIAAKAKTYADIATPAVATYAALSSDLPLYVRIPAGVVALVKGAPFVGKVKRWFKSSY